MSNKKQGISTAVEQSQIIIWRNLYTRLKFSTCKQLMTTNGIENLAVITRNLTKFRTRNPHNIEVEIQLW